MLVYVYAAALLCESCGEETREKLTAERKAPADPDDESSYDSDDFPKGPTEEGESDSPSHCDHCHEFLESNLTDEGADYVLSTAGSVLRGEQSEGAALAQWIAHYEGRDSRITLKTLADGGLTIAEILTALRTKDAKIARLTALVQSVPVQ